MKKYRVLFLSILSVGCLHAVVHEIIEFEEILPYVDIKAGPCIIVAFDIDNTLLRGIDEKARDEYFSTKFKEYTAQGFLGDEAVARILPEHINAHRTTPVVQIDADQDEVMAILQDKKIHVMALTARGNPLDFVDITLRQFRDAKVDLLPRTSMNSWHQCYKLTGLARDAYYVPGILFANGNDKGMVFEHFLKKLRYRPHLVIFVDDIMKNVQSMDRACKRLRIPHYHCFYYSRVVHGLDPYGAPLAA